MKKIFLIIALGLSLTACQTPSSFLNDIQAVGGFSVTQSQIDAARATYDATFLTPAARYRSLPTCKSGQTFLKNQCKDNSIVLQLQASDKTVESAFNQMQALVNSGNNSGLVAAYQTLQTAISTAQGLLVVNSIS